MFQLAILPGPGEWMWILGALLVLFGAKKLPELARSMGSSVTQFKKGLKEEPEQLDAPKQSGDTPTET